MSDSTVIAVTADSVLALAKSTKSLSEEQMTRIRDTLPFMNEKDLKMLQKMIEKVRSAEIKDMKRELELRKKLAAANAECKSDRTREKFQNRNPPPRLLMPWRRTNYLKIYKNNSLNYGC